MLNFTFQSPTIIHFGNTKVSALEGELKNRARKILIVTGRGSVRANGIYNEVMTFVERSGVLWSELDGVQSNPRLSAVHAGITRCRAEHIDFILAIGGGSVIDTAKAIAAGVPYEGDVWDFFRDHRGPSKALPIGTVVTLAASGSEMNGNMVITNDATKEKRACGSPVLIPVFSIVNPAFTFSVNAFHTAAGVADCMAHVFESYLAPIPGSEVQDCMAEALLRVCLKYGPTVCCEPRNYEARANMMWASTLALNGVVGKGKISDWVLHAIEHELSGLYDISHGAGLAVLLPPFMKVLMRNDTTRELLIRYGIHLWKIPRECAPQDIAREAIERTGAFLTSLGLPKTLRGLGVKSVDAATIAALAMKTRGTVGQYRQLGKSEITDIIEMALG